MDRSNNDIFNQVAAHEARFSAIDTTLAEVQRDVRSLLHSRSFTRGVWRTVVVVASTVSAAIGLAIAWIKG